MGDAIADFILALYWLAGILAVTVVALSATVIWLVVK